MLTINQIIRRFGGVYEGYYGNSMLPSHRQALDALSKCRTEEMGSHHEFCNHCGYQHVLFHSCRNRSCPLCFAKRTNEWLKKQRERLLPCPYFHLVFTVPSQLRPLFRKHQKTLYPLLFQAAQESLQKLAADEKYIGGRLGILAVLHTWSGAMIYHPHLHCLVPGGGIDSEGKWRASKKNFLVPVRALSSLFRGRFLALARKALPEEDFSVGGNVKKWVVFSKSVEQKNSERVLNYLARYLHRIAITNSRILNIENDEITFRYKKSTKKGGVEWRTMRLKPMPFLGRFLQHVLPKGMAKVRYYGFLAPSNHDQLEAIGEQMEGKKTALVIEPVPEHQKQQSLMGGIPFEIESPAQQDSTKDIPFEIELPVQQDSTKGGLPGGGRPSKKRCPQCKTGYLITLDFSSPSLAEPP